MEKIYISGPISNRPLDEAKAEFSYAEQSLQKLYPEATIVNPFNITNGETDWYKCMRICIRELVTCTTMVCLEGINKSRGAGVEWNIAFELGFNMPYIHNLIPTFYEDLEEQKKLIK